ncbi:MAG: recombinase family protein [Deltaproteobacteria bacterium]|nr:recombinase family protein [Deltaproteobacteria bacterium]
MSALETDLQPQLSALRAAGVEERHLFTDETIEPRAEWSGLNACLGELASGDTLIVWKIDRIGRSIPHLIGLMENLHGRGVGFRSLCDVIIDTTGDSGDVVTDVFSCLARFSQRVLQERARTGVETGRARGRQGGRKPIAPSDPRVRAAKAMSANGNITVSEICSTLRISRATYYRYLDLEEE